MKPVKDAKTYRLEIFALYSKWARDGEAHRQSGMNIVRELEDRKIGLEDEVLIQKIDDAIFAANDVLRVFSLVPHPQRLHPKNFEEISTVNQAINKRNKK